MRATLPVLAAVVLLTLSGNRALAAGSPGLYVGGGFGQADLKASVSTTDAAGSVRYNGEFQAHRSAFQVVAGVRPLSLVGAEIAYVDFGRPNGTLFEQPASASMHGGAAFALGYLPLPLVEVYGKAGFARLQSQVSGLTQPFGVTCPIGGCPSPVAARYYQIDRTSTGFAAGAGAQVKLGSMAVRAEYERFNAAGEHPSLVSIVVTWTVL
jgi:opacity protein-like surface antigen